MDTPRSHDPGLTRVHRDRIVLVAMMLVACVLTRAAASDDAPTGADDTTPVLLLEEPPADLPGNAPDRVISFGSARIHKLIFQPQGHRAYVQVEGEAVNVGSLVESTWPEATAAAAGLIVLVMWIRLWRRCNRIPGLAYCRKCGYCLEGLDSAKCPECGRNLTPRNRIVARRIRLRLALVSLLALGLVPAYFWLSTLPTKGWLSERLQWWSFEAHDFATAHKLQWLLNRSEWVTAIFDVDVRAGSTVRSMFIEKDAVLNSLVMAGDGSCLFAEYRSMRPTPRGGIVRIDCKAGTFEIRDAFDYSGFLKLQGCSSDGRRIVATSRNGDSLVALNWEDGTTVDGPDAPLWGDSDTFPPVFLPVRTAGDGIVLIEREGSANRELPTTRISLRRADLSADSVLAEGDRIGSAQVILTPDTSRLLFPEYPSIQQIEGTSRTRVVEVDIRTGQSRVLLEAPFSLAMCALTADGKGLMCEFRDPAWAHSIVELDLESRTWLRQFQMAHWLLAMDFHMAPDGNCMAVVADDNTDLMIDPRSILIYDLKR